jgi:23S rRNA (guanine745-N1)-methyltransferase
MWQCPLCKTTISLASNAIKCEKNHSFDKAKSGYVNLLPVQFKKSKAPGDDKAMVKARREFHQLNAYKPLKDKLVELLLSALYNDEKSNVPLKVYDAGCGEGSYLNALVSGIEDAGLPCNGAGSDISKIAVELASKAYKKSQFVVASSYELPLVDNTQDIVLQVFAPGSTEEYHRVLKTQGVLITVDPAQDHLFEVKARVYDNPKKHEMRDDIRDGFVRICSERLSFDIALPTLEQRLALIKMTPFYWKLPEGKINKIVASLDAVSADFYIQIWRKE